VTAFPGGIQEIRKENNSFRQGHPHHKVPTIPGQTSDPDQERRTITMQEVAFLQGLAEM
jgi:hypothetical protein